MKIQILGIGCGKCGRLFQAATEMAKEARLSATVEKVTDLRRILDFAPKALPALVIDGQVKSAGRALTSAEIKALFPEQGGKQGGGDPG